MSSAPTPYFTTSRATLYLGDAHDVLSKLDPLGAGLLATDPPYGIKWRSRLRRNQFALMAGDDGTLDVTQVLGEIVALHLRNHRHAYVFGYRPDQLAEALRLSGTAELIWDKARTGSGNLSRPFGPAHERLTFGVHVRSRSDRDSGMGRLSARLRRGSVLRHPRLNGQQLKHPTQKPVALMRELVESSSLPGDLVLDPFAGSGSTLVAAVLTGRRAIGVEVDPKYAAMAARRLAVAEKIADQLDKV